MSVEEKAPALGRRGAQELEDDLPRHRRRGEVAREAPEVGREDERVSVADGGDLGEARDVEERHDDERRRDGARGRQKRRDAPALQDGPGRPVRVDRVEDPPEVRNLRDERREDGVWRAGDRRDEASVEIVGREVLGPDGRRGARGGLEVPQRRGRVGSSAEEREDVPRGRGVEREGQPVGRRGREVEGRVRHLGGRRRVGRLRRAGSGREGCRGRERRQKDARRAPAFSQGSPPRPGACRRSPRAGHGLPRRRARAARCAPSPPPRPALPARGRTRRRAASRPRRRTRSP